MSKPSGYQSQLHRPAHLTRDNAEHLTSEDESIPGYESSLYDPRSNLSGDETTARCPWVGPTEGDDKDYDFLRRDEWREADFHNVTFGLVCGVIEVCWWAKCVCVCAEGGVRLRVCVCVVGVDV